MRRVAPVLQAALDNHPWVQCEGPMKQARAELRALLAVANAADKWANTGRPGPNMPCDTGLVRALARLDKASGGRGTK